MGRRELGRKRDTRDLGGACSSQHVSPLWMGPWSRVGVPARRFPACICQDCVSCAGEGDGEVMVLEGCSSAGEAQASLGVLLSAKVRAVPLLRSPASVGNPQHSMERLAVGGWAADPLNRLTLAGPGPSPASGDG